MNKAVIVEAKRTPIGKKDGILKEYEVQQLATPLLTFLSKGIKRDRRCYIRKCCWARRECCKIICFRGRTWLSYSWCND